MDSTEDCLLLLRRLRLHNTLAVHFSKENISSSTELKALWWADRIGRPLSSVRPSVRRPHSLNIFSSETPGPIKVKFHMELLWDGGTKVCSNGPGLMTKMAAMPVYGENLKNLLRNQKANDLETWYAASGARVLQSLFKWWPWVDLELFYGKVKFDPLCFCRGKKVKQWIFQKLLSPMIWN